MPTLVLITSWSASCIKYGFSPDSRFKMSVASRNAEVICMSSAARRGAQGGHVRGDAGAGEPAENDQVGKRVPAETVCAV